MLTNAIQREFRSKARQCAGWNQPTLLIIGTFHAQGSILIRPAHPGMDWVLTGEARITFPYDAAEGCFRDEAFLSTEGKDAAFIKSDLEAARKSISALLVVGFGICPPSIIGFNHVEASRPFDQRSIPSIPFGSLVVDRSTGKLGTQWAKA